MVNQIKLQSVRSSVVGLDRVKFGFYQFQNVLFIVVIVLSILLKPKFLTAYSQSLVKPLLKRLKTIGMASEKLYRNTLNVLELLLNPLLP